MDISKITPFPWFVSPKNQYIRHGSSLGWNIAEMTDQSPYTEANAKAIVSAVNSTWGAKINPEYVPDMFKLLQEYIDADDSRSDVWYKMQKIKSIAKEVINKAKIV